MPLSTFPRNAQVWDATKQPPELVAGLMQFGHTRVAEFYACLEICFQQPPPGQFRVCDGLGTVLSRDNPNTLVPITDYYVVSLGNYQFRRMFLNISGSARICECFAGHRSSPAPCHFRRQSCFGSCML